MFGLPAPMNPFAQLIRNFAQNTGLPAPQTGGVASEGIAPVFAPTPTERPSTGPATPQGGDRFAARRRAISAIESGGRYDAIGPTHSKLGRALGKYQIMEANVGPWSREVLGQALTPEQFLARPDLQDQIFDAKFDRYAQKYGEGGAAQAWFAGEGGVGKTGRKDVLGTSVGKYGDMFLAELRKQGFDDAGGGVPMGPDARPSAVAGTRGGAIDPGLTERQNRLGFEEPGPGSQKLPSGAPGQQQMGGGSPRASMEQSDGTSGPQHPVAKALGEWKVNKTTRRLRGLSPGATLGALAAMGQFVREQKEAEGQPSASN